MLYRERWDEDLGVRQVKDWIDRGTSKPYRNHRWLEWARRGAGLNSLGGRARVITDHGRIADAIEENLDEVDKMRPPSWKAKEIVGRFDNKGTLKLGQIKSANNAHLLQRVSLSTNGEAILENKMDNVPAQAYDERGDKVNGPPIWKTRWIETKTQDQKSLKTETSKKYAEDEDKARAFDGIAGITYPRLKNYQVTLNETETDITEITVKEMTRDAVDRSTARPTCEADDRWPVELRLQPGEKIDFDEVWDTFKIGIATPVDFGTRFRMIHGDLGTRSKLGEPGGCRLGCGCRIEKHIHLVECHRLQPLWGKLIAILEGLRGRRFQSWRQAVVLGWTTTEGKIEKGSTALMSMLLKIIVIDWYRMIRYQCDFDYAKVWRIFWKRAERQWKDTARDKEYELRNIHQRGSDTKTTWIGIQRQLYPLGEISRETFKVACHLDWKKHEDY